MELVILYLGLSIVVGVAANTRGRDGPGWFVLAVLISPLIAGLLVLALPKRAPRPPWKFIWEKDVERTTASSSEHQTALSQPHYSFEPQGILKGFPYRLRENGTIDAMMTGGLVHFRDMEQFRAAVDGRDMQAVPRRADGLDIPPSAKAYRHRGYTYFVRENGVELVLSALGKTRHFPNKEEAVAYIDAISGGSQSSRRS